MRSYSDFFMFHLLRLRDTLWLKIEKGPSQKISTHVHNIHILHDALDFRLFMYLNMTSYCYCFVIKTKWKNVCESENILVAVYRWKKDLKLQCAIFASGI